MTVATNPKYVRVDPSDTTFEKDIENSEMGISTNATSEKKEQSTNAQPSVSPLEQMKLQHWKDSPYAVGIVEPTWNDELCRYRRNSHTGRGAVRQCCADICSEEMEPPHCGCLFVSAVVCSCLGAKRIGNMAVLRESSVTVLEEVGESDGERRRVSRRRIDLIVGPYWPMMVGITYPLILGISLWTGFRFVPGKHPFFIAFWFLCTSGLILSLFGVGCRDPGIMLRTKENPDDDPSSPPQLGSTWRWNDQGQTFRPKGAIYDPDCAVVIEGFDHTCPWTGTAIGKKNTPSFQVFVSLIFFCLIMDILLMTSAI